MALIFCNNKLVKHQQCDESFSPNARFHVTFSCDPTVNFQAVPVAFFL